VHLKNILIYIQQGATLHSLFYLETALHVSGRAGLLTACEQEQYVPSWSCSQAVSKPVWYIPLLFVQCKTPNDGQRNCPKHAESHFKNKFEKLVHVVGFIIRNLSRCTVTWVSNCSEHFQFHGGISWLGDDLIDPDEGPLFMALWGGSCYLCCV